MHKNFTVSNYLNQKKFLMEQTNFKEFQKGINMIESFYSKNKKIFTCGNGGSAHTASHYITDWSKTVLLTTGKKFRGISLCDNLGLMTAYGNDISFLNIFSGQIDNLMDEGDLLVVVSCSGNSPNIIKAIEAARKAKGKVLGIVGYDGGKIKSLCDHSVWIKSFDMQLCEDMHLMFGHMVMKKICKGSIKI